ncbi:Ribonuclease P protein component [Mariniradius saccharolyticus AK6]|jgi:ribonuclease P protein component|uniref:Ribonuclease P protein component n=2 Tax=Mariniradius TaxID=1245590 RepID=M7XB10_9BACT|nr:MULTISPECIES: ribonuclease P protein component [Mariniradius]EMS31798.1 Ribonuclease P protein component [Mariniradius saccharolyticus AK6]MCF1752804.1 ribonuclease P protein component [Mariniradius sediminis]
MTYGFSKGERLHSQKLIKELFDKGSSFFLFPFKVLVLNVPSEIIGTNQALFSVSKKKFKKAVDRNLVKRRMREAYRLHKHLIPATEPDKKLIAFIYVSSDILTFQTIEAKMLKVLTSLSPKSN